MRSGSIAPLVAVAFISACATVRPPPRVPRTPPSELPVKRAPAFRDTPSFLYVLVPETRQIGLLWRDARPADVEHPSFADGDTLVVECGDDPGYPADPGYAYHQRLTGTTGFESVDMPCHIARNLEIEWQSGRALGAPVFYGRRVDGALQCLSFDGESCVCDGVAADHSVFVAADNDLLGRIEKEPGRLSAYFTKFDEVRIETLDGQWTKNIFLPAAASEGRTVTVDVGSTWPVIVHFADEKKTVEQGRSLSLTFSGGRWFTALSGVPEDLEVRLSAQPVVCTAEQRDTPAHWCARVAEASLSLRRGSTQARIDSKRQQMQTLLTHRGAEKVLTVRASYDARVASHKARVDSKSTERDIACGFAWSLPGAIACGVLKKELNDLAAEHSALQKERDARLMALNEEIAAENAVSLHELHQKWAAEDPTPLGALLREESQSLAELQGLRAQYEATADQMHAEAMAAAKKYMEDTSVEGVFVNGAENLPLLGKEVRHLVDFSRHPTDENLRKALLGSFGPAGELIEGGIEIAEGEGGLDDDAKKFLEQLLEDVRRSDGVGQAMEAAVGDLLDEVTERTADELQSHGLWRHSPDEAAVLSVGYASVVDLRARLSPVDFDPWQDGGATSVAFRRWFTPNPGAPLSAEINQDLLRRVADPLAFDRNLSGDISRAAAAARYAHRVEQVFAHVFGADYQGFLRHNPKYASGPATQVTRALVDVVSGIPYAPQRSAYWATSELLGSRPAALIHDDRHAVILLNRDLVDPGRDDLGRYYFEELGHLVNWWRCRIFDVDSRYCPSHGDEGRRFRDAVALAAGASGPVSPQAWADLPVHPELEPDLVQFTSGAVGLLEGSATRDDVNDHIVGRGRADVLLRLGVNLQSKEFSFLNDEYDLEAVLKLAGSATRGDPWTLQTSCSGGAHCPCADPDGDSDDCNVSTAWLVIGLRDVIQLKGSGGGLEGSLRAVRKHGFRLPYQKVGGRWRFVSDKALYFKKLSLGAQAHLDLAGLKGIDGAPFSAGLGGIPIEGSLVLDVPVSETKSLAPWITLDVLTAGLGCLGGAVAAVLLESDPVPACEAASQLTELEETLIGAAVDEHAVLRVEADSVLALSAYSPKLGKLRLGRRGDDATAAVGKGVGVIARAQVRVVWIHATHTLSSSTDAIPVITTGD